MSMCIKIVCKNQEKIFLNRNFVKPELRWMLEGLELSPEWIDEILSKGEYLPGEEPLEITCRSKCVITTHVLEKKIILHKKDQIIIYPDARFEILKRHTFLEHLMRKNTKHSTQ